MLRQAFALLVYSNIVLQHIHPHYSKQYLKEFLRVLKPGGMLVFQLPSEVVPAEAVDPSRQSRATGPLPSAAFQAQITTSATPRSRGARSHLHLQVVVRNVGSTVWPSLSSDDGRYQIKLANRWIAQESALESGESGHAILPHDLVPGEEVAMPLVLGTPAKGKYTLELDLLQEDVGWFSSYGSQPLRIPLEVDSTPPQLNGAEKLAAPVIEMYGIPKQSVCELMQSAGGRLVDVREDKQAGEYWRSFRYCITK